MDNRNENSFYKSDKEKLKEDMVSDEDMQTAYGWEVRIDRFLLFMKMFLTGLFKFAVGAVVYLAVMVGVIIMAEMIARFKILNIILLIILSGVSVLFLFIIGDDFWSRYKRERDSRGL